MVRASSPPDAARASGRNASPALAAEQERHGLAGLRRPRPRPRSGPPAWRGRPGASLDRRGQRGARPRVRAAGAAASAVPRARPGPTASSSSSAAASASARPSRSSRSGRVGRNRARRRDRPRTCGTGRRAAGGGPGPRPGARGRRPRSRRRCGARWRCRRPRPGRPEPGRLELRRARRRPSRAAAAAPRRSSAPPSAGRRAPPARGRACSRWAARSLEPFLLGRQARVLVRVVVEPGALDLVDLVLEHVVLPGPLVLVATELRRAAARARPPAGAARRPVAGSIPPNTSSARRWAAVCSRAWWSPWPWMSARVLGQLGEGAERWPSAR